MPDVFSKAKRSQVMSRIRSTGNRDTELAMVGFLRRIGISGWRRHQMLLGKPDFVFFRERVVVFVDGCFWHGCPRHGRTPTSNVGYWREKLEVNKKRDRQNSRVLKAAGWRVLRIWEHELTNRSLPLLLRKIRRIWGTARFAGKCGTSVRI